MGARHNFLKQLSNVSLFTLVSRILGFSREIVQLSIIGVNQLSDTLTAAIMLPAMIRKLTSEGLFNGAFIPIYHELNKDHGETEANIWASNVMFMVFIFSTLTLIFSELFMSWILTVFFSGFLSKTTWFLLNTLARITFISIIGSSLSSFVNSICTANKRFFLASIGSSICNISTIIISLFSTNVYHLAIAIAAGTYVQLVCTLYPIRSKIHFKRTKHKLYIFKFFKLLSPLLLSAFLIQYLLIISAWFGSWLENGHLTYINKADKLIQLPISLIGVTLNTVLIPTLLTKKHNGYITYSAKLGVILSSFIFCVIFAASESIATLTFGYGKLTSYDTNHIANILLIYSFSLPAWIIIKIWHASLASIQDNKSSMIGNIIHVLTYISLGLYVLREPSMYKLAIVSVFSVWLNFFFLTIQIKRKNLIGDLKWFLLIVLLSTFLFANLAKITCNLINSPFIHLSITTIFLSACFGGLYVFLKRYKL